MGCRDLVEKSDLTRAFYSGSLSSARAGRGTLDLLFYIKKCTVKTSAHSLRRRLHTSGLVQECLETSFAVSNGLNSRGGIHPRSLLRVQRYIF